jgi:hypothetical protein
MNSSETVPDAAVPRFVCGRPRIQFGQNAAQQWCTILNGEVQPGQVGRCSKKKFFFRRHCGKHLALMTPEGVHKSESALRCQLCDSPGEQSERNLTASEYEKIAARVIEATAPECGVVTQARVVEGFNGGTDFTIQLPTGAQVDVEVDGEQYFEKAYHDTSPQQQRALDLRKDSMSLEQRRRRVRLHYKDMPWWTGKIKGAIALARFYPNLAYNLYTPSYGVIDRFDPPFAP